MSATNKKVYMEDYSEKSFIVRGDTRPHRESLKNLGGKWSNRLTDKSSGEKIGAWLFWSAKRKEVQEWIEGGMASVDEAKPDHTSFVSQPAEESRLARIESKLTRIEDLLQKLSSALLDEEMVKDTKPKRLLGNY